jgi:hypothetical protein
VDLVIPPALAVITAVALVLIVEAVALKVAEIAPAPTDALTGTLKTLLLDVSDTVVADNAAFVIVTVHRDEPPEPSVVGLHARPDSCGGVWETVMLPPVAEAGMALPSAPAAKVPVN